METFFLTLGNSVAIVALFFWSRSELQTYLKVHDQTLQSVTALMGTVLTAVQEIPAKLPPIKPKRIRKKEPAK